MSPLYLASSRENLSEAAAVAAWLRENGWESLVCDVDRPTSASATAPSLLEPSLSACCAVLFLISKASLQDEKLAFKAQVVRKLGKRVFFALIDPIDISALPAWIGSGGPVIVMAATSEGDQPYRPTPGSDDAGGRVLSLGAMESLGAALARARLDPLAFDWPPEVEKRRACYRGLQPLTEADAGIFFGRDVTLMEALDTLRRLADEPAGAAVVLLGESGAGKSSFLRAGLIPRLARERERFALLPVLRPDGGGLFGAQGLANAIEHVARESGETLSGAQIRDAIEGGADALRRLLKGIWRKAERSSASSILPKPVLMIDPAEELFLSRDGEENRALLSLLSDMTAWDDPGVIVLYAAPAGTFESLRRAVRTPRPPTIFPLPRMTREEFAAVVEGPLQRMEPQERRAFDPDLLRAILDEAEAFAGNPLPLLAFALAELSLAGGRDKKIDLADYEKIGRLSGCVDMAGDRALGAAGPDERLPQEYAIRLSLLRRGLIPWLACLDLHRETPQRRPAAKKEIPALSLPLIERLEQERLVRRVTVDGSPDAAFELVHDALFEHWSLLKSFMAEEPRLGPVLERLKQASREWDSHARSDDWIVHSGVDLEKAERIYAQPEALAQLGSLERAYLVACRRRENAEPEPDTAVQVPRVEVEQRKTERSLQKSARARRFARVAWIGMAAAASIAGFSTWQWRSSLRDKSDAEARLARAEASIDSAILSSNRLATALLQKLTTANGEQSKLVKDVAAELGDLQERLDGAEASSNRLRRNQSVGLNVLAQSWLATGDTARALAAAQKSVALMQALTTADAANAGWRRDLSVSYEKLGDAQLAAGDVDAALASYRYDLTIARTLASTTPDNAQLRWDLSVSCEKLGDVLLAKGESEKALEVYGESRAIREALLAGNPANKSWERGLAVSYERMGSALANRRDVAGATASYEGALEIYQRLTRADPTDVQTLVSSIVPRWRLAGLDRRRAREHLGPALDILEKLAAEGRLADDKREWLAQVRTELAALDQTLVQTP